MAERALVWALDQRSLSYRRMPGEAVFYGPKIDIKMLDALGRTWQGPTVQFDFNLPSRLDIHYLNSESKETPVVMIHRAVLGSFGTVFRRTGGALCRGLPLLARPRPGRRAPHHDRVHDFARSVRDRLVARGDPRASGRAEREDRREDSGRRRSRRSPSC